ncbi:MAG: LysR family transcriptional regulator [Erysipelotrichaceae bacterium]|nr:LysR family transcriptional regulator [Erysipelotrichaceae bacterium]
MDHIKLKTFITVVDTGSINKAADILKMAPVSLKRQLDAIENEMNTSLLIRNSEGTKLTDAGKLYYGFANKTLADFNKLNNEIKAIHSAASNSLIICTGREYATLPLDLFSTEFLIKNPTKKVLYLPSDSEDWFDLVLTKRADAAFVTYEQYLDKSEYQLNYIHMYHRDYMIVLSPNDLLIKKEKITFCDLKNRTIVLNANSFPELYKCLKENHINVINSTESPSTSAVFNHISENQLYITLDPIDKQYAPLKSVRLDFPPIRCGWLVQHKMSQLMGEYIELSKEVSKKHSFM